MYTETPVQATEVTLSALLDYAELVS